MSKHIGTSRYAGVALGVMALSFFGGCDKFKSPADYIQGAEAHRAQGELFSAIIDLKNALQKDGKNREARLLLARYYLDFPDPQAAEGVLLRARADGISQKDTAASMAEADLRLNKPADAFKETLIADDPQAAFTKSQKADLLGLRAEALMAQGQVSAALAAQQTGYSEDPKSIIVLTSMVDSALHSGDFVEAKRRIEEAKKIDPDSFPILAQEASIAYKLGDYAGAEKDYVRLRKLAHWNVYVAVELARTLIAENKFKDADAQLVFVLKVDPDHLDGNYLQALSAYRQHDLKTAKERAERVLAKLPNFAPALLLSGATAFGLHQLEQASQYLSQYVFLRPDDVKGRELLGNVAVALGRPADAVKALTPVADTSTDPQLLSTIATASAHTGDFGSANRYLTRAVQLDPYNATLRTQLGTTQISLGNTSGGIDELERASRADPTSALPEVTLIFTYLQQKDFQKALELAQKFQKSHPDNPIGFDLTGSAQMALGDDKAGEQSFLKARSLKPGDAIAARSLAAIALKKNDPDLAIKYYQELLAANPKDTQTSLAVAELAARQGHLDIMRQVLQNAIDQNPENDVTPRLILGRFLVANRQFQSASEMIEPALAKEPKNSALLETYGNAQLGLGNADSALRTFKTFAAVLPQSALAHRYLAQAYAQARDGSSAIAEAKKAVELDPHDLASNVLLAQFYLSARHFDQAREISDRLAAQAPGDANVAQLQAVVASAQNRREDSIAAYRRVSALVNTAASQANLARALFQAGHRDEARRVLENWLKDHPTDALIRIALGDMALSLKQYDKAVTEYEAGLKQTPGNASAENNLAWALLQKGDPKTALGHARRAAQISGSAPEILDTLGVILMQNKQPEEAIETLQGARKLAPNQPGISFHLAQALVLTGEKNAAKPLLRDAIASDLPFDERDQAQALLAKLSG